jgi:hypothetical protein
MNSPHQVMVVVEAHPFGHHSFAVGCCFIYQDGLSTNGRPAVPYGADFIKALNRLGRVGLNIVRLFEFGLSRSQSIPEASHLRQNGSRPGIRAFVCEPPAIFRLLFVFERTRHNTLNETTVSIFTFASEIAIQFDVKISLEKEGALRELTAIN